MPASPTWSLDELRAVIAQHWGFNALRPMQEQAMRAVLDERDSLVVLPTGGGKSLCYQAPAVYRGGTTVVLSPLIALMKDQVDGLRANGIVATQLDSTQTTRERGNAEAALLTGQVRLLFISPERLIQTDLCRLLQRINLVGFAIDEAHCISHWGHDFRPEYRMLSKLREFFPGVAVHAYTATATEQVRRDIIQQLQLNQPEVLVGDFDRPNLTYRVLPRHQPLKQVLEILKRHQNESGIIYCGTRREVDDTAASLRGQGINALPYHAGMGAAERQAAQEAFISERCDVIVATIAFGMGIDRSNVRFVLHTSLPRSLEHYQQEAGRAGRDGLEAECVLLYSGGDVISWKKRLAAPREDGQPLDARHLAVTLRHLDDMDRYARGAVCRHKALVGYFGQPFEAESCRACDICLGDTEEVPDATTVAKKILSCVARVEQRFGIGHVVAVLRGKSDEKIRQRGHDKLSTFGLLQDESEQHLRDWVHQLIGHGFLVQTEDEYPILKLNEESWEVMRGQRSVRLIQIKRRKKGEGPAKSKVQETSWEGVDETLFDQMRTLRRDLATAKQVPSYVIFSDATLRELARVRPTTLERMRLVSGVGDVKLRDYGPQFLALINNAAQERGLPQNAAHSVPAKQEAKIPATAAGATRQQVLFGLFKRQASIEEAMVQSGLARSTVVEHLAEYIRRHRPDSIAAWVPEETYQRVVEAVRAVGPGRLKPVYVALGEDVDYDTIRLVMAQVGDVESTETEHR